MRRSGGGSIVNVSTVVAARGLRNLTPYAASKGGINALTIQLGGRAGAVRDPRQRVRSGATNVERNLVDDPEYAEKWAPLIPLGRIAEPEDMVGPTVFFACDESAHVTGRLLCVDGGWTSAAQLPGRVRRRGTRAVREAS